MTERRFSTAPELVDAVAAAVGLDDTRRARQLAETYGGVGGARLSRAPSTIAGAAVYIAARERQQVVTQAEAAAASDCCVAALRDCVHQMARAEGDHTAAIVDRHWKQLEVRE
jgi:transcription initiation factor TFIIIB Brf1 subunit/transcription initiation factor TFIIB